MLLLGSVCCTILFSKSVHAESEPINLNIKIEGVLGNQEEEMIETPETGDEQEINEAPVVTVVSPKEQGILPFLGEMNRSLFVEILFFFLIVWLSYLYYQKNEV